MSGSFRSGLFGRGDGLGLFGVLAQLVEVGGDFLLLFLQSLDQARRGLLQLLESLVDALLGFLDAFLGFGQGIGIVGGRHPELVAQFSAGQRVRFRFTIESGMNATVTGIAPAE